MAFLFILRAGAAWAGLPERYPPYQTLMKAGQAGKLKHAPLNLLTALGYSSEYHYIRQTRMDQTISAAGYAGEGGYNVKQPADAFC